jgi:hypothetical protein
MGTLTAVDHASRPLVSRSSFAKAGEQLVGSLREGNRRAGTIALARSRSMGKVER